MNLYVKRSKIPLILMQRGKSFRPQLVNLFILVKIKPSNAVNERTAYCFIRLQVTHTMILVFVNPLVRQSLSLKVPWSYSLILTAHSAIIFDRGTSRIDHSITQQVDGHCNVLCILIQIKTYVYVICSCPLKRADFKTTLS